MFLKDNTETELKVPTPTSDETHSMEPLDIPDISTPTSSSSTSSSTSASLDYSNSSPMLCYIDSMTKIPDLSSSFTKVSDLCTFAPRHSSRESTFPSYLQRNYHCYAATESLYEPTTYREANSILQLWSLVASNNG